MGWLETATKSELEQLLRDLADGVVIADASGNIVFWNSEATQIFGWSAAYAVGRSLDIIIPERLRARHWAGYERVMETGETSYGNRLLEVPATHRDGHIVSVAFTVTLLRSADESLLDGIVALLRDDTEGWNQRRLDGQRIAALEAQQNTGPSRDDRTS